MHDWRCVHTRQFRQSFCCSNSERGPYQLSYASKFCSGPLRSREMGGLWSRAAHDFKFITQRLSKVPQPVEQKRAMGKEILAISTLLAGTIIAKSVLAQLVL